MEKDKTAIVISGGGMSCAYSQGALQGLEDKFQLQPDLLIGLSGSSPNVSYFATGQTKEWSKSWQNVLSHPEALKAPQFHLSLEPYKIINNIRNLLNRKVDIGLGALVKTFNQQYLMQCLTDRVPLDLEKLHESPVETILTTTHLKSGETRYFSNQDPQFKDRIDEKRWLDVIKAACSLPLVFPKPAVIDGEEYIDGALSAPLIENVRLAVKKGANKIISIKNDYPYPAEPFTELLVMTHMQSSSELRRIIWRYLRKQIGYIPWEFPKVEHVQISPMRRLKTGYTKNVVEQIYKSFWLGYSDAVTNRKLERMLNYTSDLVGNLNRFEDYSTEAITA